VQLDLPPRLLSRNMDVTGVIVHFQQPHMLCLRPCCCCCFVKSQAAGRHAAGAAAAAAL
jgi:hypothetical protein